MFASRFNSLRPDVVIMDIGMEEMDGYTLVGKVRALSPEKKGGWTPAVALTPFAGPRTGGR